jgi:hypothetical protein
MGKGLEWLRRLGRPRSVQDGNIKLDIKETMGGHKLDSSASE